MGIVDGALNKISELAKDGQEAVLNALGDQEQVAAGEISYDVIKDYKWSLNTSEQARALAPKIRIKLLEMRTGQLWQLLSQALNLITDPYDGIYKLDVVGRDLWLPYFSGDHHSNSHSWEPLSLDTLGSIAGGVGTTIGAGAQAVLGAAKGLRSIGAALAAPGYKTETPYVWRDTNLEAVVVDFNLYNTSPEEYGKNKKFINEMIYWTLPKKLKATFAIPPVLCEYEIPGIRRGLIARVDFAVSNKGQAAFHSGENVPDAYGVTFTLTDLLMQTKNIHKPTGPVSMGSNISPNATTVYGGAADAASVQGAIAAADQAASNNQQQ